MCSGRIVGQPDVIPAARNISTGDKSQLHSKPLLDRVNECNRLFTPVWNVGAVLAISVTDEFQHADRKEQ